VTIPDFQTIMLPLLRAVADGQPHRYAELRDSLEQSLSLTDADRRERLPSGQRAVLKENPTRVDINLSRRMLQDQRLPAMVSDLLARWDVAPTALVLEITESSLMADPVRAGENLQKLRTLGLRMSIHDFGTGYSSLASSTGR
jgi:EAL domain-containing protein (putative c-di-GMP-specific phosphodiesterase class I)